MSLRWIVDHLDWFRLNLDSEFARHLKALNEISIVLRPWSRWIGALHACDELGAMVETITDFVWEQATSSIARELFYSLPQERIHVLRSYLSMRGTRRNRPEFDYLANNALDLNYLRHTELTPFRRLEIESLLFQCGLISQQPNWQELFGRTLLASRCESIWYSDDDAYAATHSILFVTNFGEYPLSVACADTAQVTRVLRELAVHHARMGFLDLLGELLICLCLSGDTGSCYDVCSDSFLAAVTSDGSVPARCPEDAGAVLSPFWGRYHTTIVALTYCLIHLTSRGAVEC